MSETRQRILDDIKLAMKAHDKPRLGTLRLVSAAIKQREVDERIELDEPATIAMLDKMQKQRRESITQYAAAGRDDLVAVEQAEMDIIGEYLPAAMSESEVAAVVASAIAETGATSIKDMGKVMAQVKPVLQGRVDMASVSQSIKQELSG